MTKLNKKQSKSMSRRAFCQSAIAAAAAMQFAGSSAEAARTKSIDRLYFGNGMTMCNVCNDSCKIMS